MTPARVEVFFDGGCPLCRREINAMRRMDRQGAIAFTDISGDDAVCPLDPATMMARFHASEDGRMLSGAAAFAAMWRAIPALRPLGLMARNPAVLAVFERLYLAFLKLRPRLQRWAWRWSGPSLRPRRRRRRPRTGRPRAHR